MSALQILQAAETRIADPEDKVRMHAVAAICDAAVAVPEVSTMTAGLAVAPHILHAVPSGYDIT